MFASSLKKADLLENMSSFSIFCMFNLLKGIEKLFLPRALTPSSEIIRRLTNKLIKGGNSIFNYNQLAVSWQTFAGSILCVDELLFSVLYHCKLNIYNQVRFWTAGLTKQAS